MPALLVALLIGATLRLTRLLTSDALLEPPRTWIERRAPASLTYLIRCDWCLSVWVGFAVFLGGWHAPDAITWIASGALSASLIAGWSATIFTAIEVVVWGDGDDGS
jgi:hypothetical protein